MLESFLQSLLVVSLLVDMRVLGNIPRHGTLLFIGVDCQIFSHCSKTENCFSRNAWT